MNRPIMKEHYTNQWELARQVDRLSQSPNEGDMTPARQQTLKNLESAYKKHAQGKQLTDDEIAARLDAASLTEGSEFRQQEALINYQIQQATEKKIDKSRSRAIEKGREYE